jgi:hypothetical protein
MGGNGFRSGFGFGCGCVFGIITALLAALKRSHRLAITFVQLHFASPLGSLFSTTSPTPN